ncbi:unnamed protein product, partial [Gulo gulo]
PEPVLQPPGAPAPEASPCGPQTPGGARSWGTSCSILVSRPRRQVTPRPRSGRRGACAPAPAAKAGRPARASACPLPTARSAAGPCAS